MGEATTILEQLARHPGYQYLPIATDWSTLCHPFLNRLQGTRQVTDAYLLGLAISNNLILVTMDKAILHMAGTNHGRQVMVLEAA